jgi:hypothetical protein
MPVALVAQSKLVRLRMADQRVRLAATQRARRAPAGSSKV